MILFLAGTSDARELAIQVKAAGYEPTATVVTESAETSLKEVGLNVKVGRNTADDMVQMIANEGYRAVIDASHPFAEEASKNAMAAAKEAGVPYIRFEREREFYNHPLVTVVKDYEQAALLAKAKGGVIMLTTGSKTLQTFTNVLNGVEGVRLLARMLPRLDNMEKCAALDVPQKNIIAIQGPFSKELNVALYHQYDVDVMVTKESGKVGSVDEKLEAAIDCGVETIMIARPDIAYGHTHATYEGVINELNEILGGTNEWISKQTLNH